ncbi:LOW QUALITY PROTEIN: proteasome assembly chaperone 2-like [Pteropus medius]|uniref:LOW QUALITY PROTEIN: proteasome assembly chaperone 2-like n=1 Tax=Pteropus vampyrus TaxID=132908 RepID=UPI00196AF297|nr:LOW QUALITY PROTEIN: proteasome assembly chaperone 2-like [Pteropus giganteus]
MFVPYGESVPNLAGFTLLMPAVSVGNVGQLAIHLIISILNMCKIGYFYTDCLVLMVGNNPYAMSEDSTELSINAEVYLLPSKKLVALQLRFIFIKYKSKPFCEKLISWVKNSNCAKVIVLSSSHSYYCNDLQLLRYLLTSSMPKKKQGGCVQNKIKSLNWEEMEKSQCIPETHDSEFCIHIPGGGIKKPLYDEGCSKEIPMAVLLKFVLEEDNIPDALGLVEYLNEWLQIIKPHLQCDYPTASAFPWKISSSWRLLFGSSLPLVLFLSVFSLIPNVPRYLLLTQLLNTRIKSCII